MENFDNAAFGVRIVNLRKEKNLPQSKLAELTGITQQTLSRYEKGERQASLDFVIHAAAVFGVSADYLLGLSDVRSTEQDMKCACEVTGLSEKAVLNIKRITGEFFGERSIDVFENKAFYWIMLHLSSAIYSAQLAAEYATFDELDKKDVATFTGNFSRDEEFKNTRVKLLDVYESMKGICDKYFKKRLKEVADDAQHHTTEE